MPKAVELALKAIEAEELVKAMTHRHAPEAWLVSTVGFSQAAKKFAAGKPLKLITIDKILQDE